VNLTNTIEQVKANGTTSTGLQGAGVMAARADEETALGLADQVRTQIAKAKIISPVDGIVVNRNLNPGEYPGTRQVFTVQETDLVYASLNGSGSQIVSVKPGGTATITSPDLPGRRLSGRVIGVLDAVNPGSTNFIVKVLMKNPEGVLLSGMTVSGTVARAAARGIKVPETSFSDDTDSTVQTIRNGKVVTVNVTKIATDGTTAVVSGLPVGEQVVVNGQLGLIDGQDVTPQTPKVAER
jgi:RND family efflux transporter MFP subunit